MQGSWPTQPETVGMGRRKDLRPRPPIGHWRVPVELHPAEAFSDEEPTAAEERRLALIDDPRQRGRHSATVALRIGSSCAGWKEQPTAAEFYEAVHGERPTSRDGCILRMWASEATWMQLVSAWAERAYTLRELVAALHRTGNSRCMAAHVLNRWVRYPERRQQRTASG